MAFNTSKQKNQLLFIISSGNVFGASLFSCHLFDFIFACTIGGYPRNRVASIFPSYLKDERDYFSVLCIRIIVREKYC